MKKLNLISLALLLCMAACKKDKSQEITLQPANLNVVNALLGTDAIKVNQGMSTNFAWSRIGQVNYGATGVFGALVGNHTVTVVKASDTTSNLVSRSCNYQTINTLYLSGRIPAVDTLYRSDINLPFINNKVVNPDSSFYIRFVNLLVGSPTLKVTLNGGAASEFSGLGYKNISDFKKYSAKSTAPTNYSFEVRDATSGVLLFSYPLTKNNGRFHTTNLVIRGQAGGTGSEAPGITLMNYF